MCHIEIFAPRHTYIINNYHILFRTKLLIIQSEMACTKLIQRVFYDRILIIEISIMPEEKELHIYRQISIYTIQL